MNKTTRIALAKIAAPHGVKGLVKLTCYGDDPSLLESLSPVYTAANGTEQVSVTLKNPLGKFMLAAIDTIQNRNDAEAAKGIELFVDSDALPKLTDNDGYYYHDLVGLDVQTTDGLHFGKVIAVDNFGASDLLEIKPPSGKAFYLPFTDDYVSEVAEIVTIQNHEEFME